MLKGLKWVGVTVLGMGVLVGGVLLVSWLMPVPAEERRALQVMEAGLPAMAPERNAFPAIWLLDHDSMTPAQIQAQTAEDARRWAPGPARGAAPAGDAVAVETHVAKVTPATGWCRRDVSACLAAVRADADAVAQAHAGHDGLHARIAALGEDDHYRSLFVPDTAMPFPAFQVLMERTSWHALAHVRGNSTQALQGTCEDIRTGRMLMARSDSVLVAMVGSAMAERNAGLFTEILAELPAGADVPATCQQALVAPTVAELDLCLPMRGEFAFVRAAMANQPALEQAQGWLHVEGKTQARNAWQMSRTCGAKVQAQIHDDRPVQLPAAPSIWSLACVANAAGCMTLAISEPAYDDYSLRMQDAGAQLRLAGAMLWLHGQPRGQTDALARLAAMPQALRSTQRPPQLSADGQRVQVPRYGRAGDGGPPWVSAALPQAWRPH